MRRLAKERDLSLVHVADFAGIGRTTLFRLINLSTPCDPRLSTLAAVAAVLDVEPAALVALPNCEPAHSGRRSE
ncbi:MAG: helix-turn-helix transcriptional regulator [bacterium]